MSEVPLVLVVEDEFFLQADLECALNGAGFPTAVVSSGEEALNLFHSDRASCQALVTDVRLAAGGMSGWDVARQIREKEPVFPVIYVTGAPAEEWAANGVPNSILISKPVAAARLVAALSSLLNTG
jgi:CheY-like chemotaxis protein